MTATVRTTALVLALLLVSAACGDADDAGPDATPEGTAAPVRVDDGRGWLDGDPADAPAPRVGAGDGDDAVRLESEEMADEAIAEATADTVVSDRAEADSDDTEIVEPGPGPSPEPALAPRAGSIDDNARWVEYLSWRDTVAAVTPHRSFDVADRSVVTVLDEAGGPLVDATVVVAGADGSEATLRTRAGGRVLLHPAARGLVGDTFEVRVGDVTVPLARGADAEVRVAGPGATPTAVDLHVVLDTTGSMSDEIAQLRAAVAGVARGADALGVDLRLGMTVYRDEGDAYVTRTFDLTGDVGAFSDALAGVVADGGGDGPEALDEALAAALDQPSWRLDTPTVRIVLVIADAPPQVGRQLDAPYPTTLLGLAERGVKVHTVAASGTDDAAEYAFRELAAATDGRFVFLSYAGGGTATGGSTDTGEVAWEELPLDELIVRLIALDVAGSDAGPPPSTPVTTTTVPAPGQ